MIDDEWEEMLEPEEERTDNKELADNDEPLQTINDAPRDKQVCLGKA